MNEYNYNENNTEKTNEHKNKDAEIQIYIKLFVLLILATIIIVSSLFYKNDNDNKILIYNKNEVYYKIQTVDEALYSARVINTYKENGKEPIYKIQFVNDSGKSLIFDWNESEYKRLLGKDNNALTISYSTVYLKIKGKKSGILLDEIYHKKYIKYSFEDNYEPFTVNNIEDEIEDFLKKVTATQLEQMKELQEIDEKKYQVDYAFSLKMFIVNDDNYILYNKQNGEGK